MTHTTEQIAAAIVAEVAKIPEFGGRVYKAPGIGWDRVSFPAVLVDPGVSRITTNRTGTGRRTGRLQDRTTTVVVEIHERATSETDFVASLASLAVAVERAATAVHSAVPIDDLVVTGDSGTEVEARDQNGIHARRAIALEVTYLTIEGDPSAFVEPNY